MEDKAEYEVKGEVKCEVKDEVVGEVGENGISQEKLDWLKDVGIEKLDKLVVLNRADGPKVMVYGNSRHTVLYSEEYLRDTSLEELLRGFFFLKELKNNGSVL